MSDVLHTYQTDLSGYIGQVRRGYDLLATEVGEHLGGMAGKTVLDLGVGFQLIHGGLTLALAIKAGATRCFGIDIAHPELHSTNAAKVDFWRQAQELLDVDVQCLDEGRVVFASTDILHFDEFFSKITLLQMSASNMWFRDDMFDVAISNAVFEHVKKPKEVLAELYRVLKPGGGAAITWNPYSGFMMGGHDVGLPYHYPWAHLRLAEEEHVEKLREVFSDEALYTTAFPREHTPSAERAAVYAADPALFRKQIKHDLNEMRIPEFERYAREVGFEIPLSRAVIRPDHQKYLTPEIRQELSAYSDEELLQTYHIAVLRKPDGRASGGIGDWLRRRPGKPG